LAALIALARALTTNKIQVETSILFAGSVGEEGEGNLRGVRHLFNTGKWAGRISDFVSLDGAGLEQITNGALGSRRYRVQLHGPGGHSWGDFGLANPVHALGRAISSLAAYPAPVDPRTSFNVGRVSGGSSINAIPGEASMEVDLRSISEDELVRLDAFFRRMVREAVEQENSKRRKETPPLELSLNLIGERPSGETPAQSPIVSLAQEATRAVERTPVLERASTDSNVPIALGIPAITLGAGGTSGNQHTIDEWYDPRDRHLGLKRALLVMLGLAGLSPVLNTGKSN
jgi:acetylornithine deacetylase/succinyl-diaminopimelate desuccinylase-like protein